MSDILKITSMSTAKNYSTAQKPLLQSNAVFDLVDLNKVVKTNDKTESQRQTNNNSEADIKPQFESQLNISKDASFTSKLMTELLDKAVSLSPDSENLPEIKEFNEFVKNIFLSKENLGEDIKLQRDGLTSFNGELFDLIKTIMSQSGSAESDNIVSSFLRNLFTLESQNNILTSTGENIKYLAELLSRSSSLSQKLSELADKFLEPDAVRNFSFLKQSATDLLSSASSSLISSDKTENLISLINYNLSRFCDNPAFLKSSFQALLDSINDEILKEQLTQAYENYIQKSNIAFPAKDALLAENKTFINADKLSAQISKELSESEPQTPSEKLSSELIKLSQSPVETVSDGNKIMSEIMKNILSDKSQDNFTQLLQTFSDSKDLDSLILRLRQIISSLPDGEMKKLVADSTNNVLTSLSHLSDITYHEPNSLDTIVDFMSKALGNQNIKYLGIVDPETLVKNMLTSPGVYTPLMHFVLPLKQDDTRAFGELWVDPDSEKGNQEKANHLFLTFDIEDKGTFELEMYDRNKSLDLSVYCPDDYVDSISRLKSTFAEIVRSKGYSLNQSSVSVLTRTRDLTDVFPSILKRRSGIDVKA